MEDLRRQEGRNLIAVGVYGSVAAGRERASSDLDLFVVIRRPRSRLRFHVREGVLVALNVRTREEARADATRPRSSLPEALSGWRSMRPLYDPSGFLRALRTRALRTPASRFRESAREGFLQAYEDLGKLRNAAHSRDREESREMAIWYTGGAMAILFCLERHVPSTDRRVFAELRGLGTLGRRICELRYGSFSPRETARRADRIWGALRAQAARQGIRVDDVP